MRCAVLGDPIAHSLSPVLHRAGYAAAGLDWAYEAVRVDEAGLPGFLAGLDDGWRGLSLTMPLKRAVLPLATRVGELARLAGAANTLVLVDGERHVDNTDLPGAMAAIAERYDGPLESVAVLGGGATAASIGLATVMLGAREVVVLARRPDRAAETVAAIAAHPSAPRVEARPLDDVPRADALVSTVPAEAQTPELVARWGAAPLVFEALYEPWPTPLARAASLGGAALVSGLDLLVHQAALQFTAFTGLAAPLASMRAAGEAALAERG
ncbi:shikimate dehydrogenase [Nocardioides sp. TRM66260-LWL]|uniref:shikimate dehydrogenase n=1 Tax=Nocardioides sp. TRM66260-LWL TaxID=2874478 RepID=UPI001CC7F9A4|nr:shikimate dehydrogenase [Nocardioides sp. TRM66260-LWL]MBZ5733828.1 shikimate dehydrogenase [Nocardioides sp. TRM66260-LWL]